MQRVISEPIVAHVERVTAPDLVAEARWLMLHLKINLASS